jgi:hypothetical protein
METNLLNIVNNLEELKARMPHPGMHVLLVAKAVIGDNLGGFYRWDPDASGAEDTVYMNTIPSNNSTTGRWIRVFQKAQAYPHGVLVRNGAVKSFWVAGISDANGDVTVNLTEDGTATGKEIFQEVWSTQCEATVNMVSANDAVVVTRKSLSANRKVLVYRLARGKQTTLGLSLGQILGVGISGLQAASSGIPCQIRVDGI